MTEDNRPVIVQPSPGPLDPAERAAIVGRRLRQIFDEVAAEPIPDAFKDLLGKLE